jgi:hypothetical protein
MKYIAKTEASKTTWQEVEDGSHSMVGTMLPTQMK